VEVSDEGTITHLKEFGFIKLLRKVFKKDDSRHYILYLPNSEELGETTRSQFVILIGALKTFTEQSNKFVEFVVSW
jgi:hypothetical protein